MSAGTANDLIFVAVADAIREHDLPVSLFSDLLSAFRQDVTTSRYERWVDVLDYCSRSANPVGRLVLRIAGYRDDALDRSSDALCTALQLTNFWQDFARDWQNGRLYVPREDYESFGASASAISKRPSVIQERRFRRRRRCRPNGAPFWRRCRAGRDNCSTTAVWCASAPAADCATSFA